MAIKGRKKPKGGSARRRPAAAPRPAYAARRKPPFHKTTGGRIVLGLGALALIILSIVVIAKSNSSANKLEARQEQLRDFTGRVRAFETTVSGTISEMAAATVPDAPLNEEDAAGWGASLQEAQGEVVVLEAPPEIAQAGSMLSEAVGLYTLSARTLEQAAGVEDDEKLKANLISHAAEIRVRGDTAWGIAVSLLDQALVDAEREPSGLTAPGSAAQSAPPVTSGTGSTQNGDDSGGDDSSDDGDSGKDSKKRNRKGGKGEDE